jgi:hypothetical protein
MAVLFLTLPSAAMGQAVRTWISANGDDSGDCLRTAPCRTWQGALVKTAAGGEIDALDSGPYGTVVIDKSITLEGAGVHAGTIASFSDAIVIDNPTAKVVIRRLVLNGGSDVPGNTPGPYGIRVNAARKVRIESVRVAEFQNAGIRIAPTNSPSRTVIVDSLIADNGANGIGIAPGSTGPRGSANRVTLRDVEVIGNGGQGVGVSAAGSYFASASIFGSLIADNAVDGIRSEGPQARVRLSNTDVIGNMANGLRSLNGGQILSWQNNRVGDNGVNGAPTGTLGPS